MAFPSFRHVVDYVGYVWYAHGQVADTFKVKPFSQVTVSDIISRVGIPLSRAGSRGSGVLTSLCWVQSIYIH